MAAVICIHQRSEQGEEKVQGPGPFILTNEGWRFGEGGFSGHLTESVVPNKGIIIKRWGYLFFWVLWKLSESTCKLDFLSALILSLYYFFSWGMGILIKSKLLILNLVDLNSPLEWITFCRSYKWFTQVKMDAFEPFSHLLIGFRRGGCTLEWKLNFICTQS